MEITELVEKITEIRDEKMQHLEKVIKEKTEDKNMNFCKKDLINEDYDRSYGYVKALNDVLKIILNGSD